LTCDEVEKVRRARILSKEKGISPEEAESIVMTEINAPIIKLTKVEELY
jgi:hypothetical protein